MARGQREMSYASIRRPVSRSGRARPGRRLVGWGQRCIESRSKLVGWRRSCAAHSFV